MPARNQIAGALNGGRVLAFAVPAPDPPPPLAPEPTAVRTRLLIVGTPATARQLIAGLSEVRGVVASGCVLVGPASESSIAAVPVLGGAHDLPRIVARCALRNAALCLPAAMHAESRAIESALHAAGIRVRRVTPLQDLLTGVEGEDGADALTRHGINEPGPHRFTAAPSIDLAALIGRTPYEMDRPAISAILRGKCVLISGAGGSIGSELAKVAAAFEPARLVLMERSENALFEIDRQIGRHFPGVLRTPVLHDVVDAEATLRLCQKFRPHAVFHAAAHKHVPLMEDHPAHAVTNNLFGTKSIADAALATGAERFVMISSDKAVNPTSVMGATKRLAEMYIRALGERSASSGSAPTRFSMVRFGNVLGSSASVLTIWAQQIAEGGGGGGGGPLTITDPRMTRFFMTIPEAATLVVQSATLDAPGAATGCEGGVGVYVLDMGEPVRIVDLAERFVRAHGMTPRLIEGVSPATPPSPTTGMIDLVCTGIRPGEKLHEELAYAAEQLRPTTHPGIRAWAGPGFGPEVARRMREMVDELNAARFSPDPARVVQAIRLHVPEMRSGPSPAPGNTTIIG